MMFLLFVLYFRIFLYCRTTRFFLIWNVLKFNQYARCFTMHFYWNSSPIYFLFKINSHFVIFGIKSECKGWQAHTQMYKLNFPQIIKIAKHKKKKTSKLSKTFIMKAPFCFYAYLRSRRASLFPLIYYFKCRNRYIFIQSSFKRANNPRNLLMQITNGIGIKEWLSW